MNCWKFHTTVIPGNGNGDVKVGKGVSEGVSDLIIPNEQLGKFNFFCALPK